MSRNRILKHVRYAFKALVQFGQRNVEDLMDLCSNLHNLVNADNPGDAVINGVAIFADIYSIVSIEIRYWMTD